MGLPKFDGLEEADRWIHVWHSHRAGGPRKRGERVDACKYRSQKLERVYVKNDEIEKKRNMRDMMRGLQHRFIAQYRMKVLTRNSALPYATNRIGFMN